MTNFSCYALPVERLSSSRFVPKWVKFEHSERYRFAHQTAVGRVIVDCACGDGTGTRLFSSSAGRLVLAFDMETRALEAGSANDLDNVLWGRANGLSLPVGSSTVDTFISLETIEHILPVQQFLQEVCRVLKPDGIFICSTPNRTVTNPGKTLGDKPWNRFHVREYSFEEFMNNLGFYFSAVVMYGQNPNFQWRVKLLSWFGRLDKGYLAVKLNQVLKLPLVMLDQASYHVVQPLQDDREYEYLVAVCKSPRKLVN